MDGRTVFLFLSVLVPVTSFITQDCIDATGTCMSNRISDLVTGGALCSSLTSYYTCVIGELQSAQRVGTCGELVILARKVVERDTLENLLSGNVCNIEIPQQLRLDTCDTEIGRCGHLAVTAFTSKDIPTKCGRMDDFVQCMLVRTTSCVNMSKVNDLLLEEVSSANGHECFAATDHTEMRSTRFPPITLPPLPSVPPPSFAPFTPAPPPQVKTAPTGLVKSGSQATKGDLNTLKSDLQRSLDLQSVIILQATNQQYQAFQNLLLTILTGHKSSA